MGRERHRARRRRRASTRFLAVLLLAGGAACGGGSGPATTAVGATDASTTTTAPGAAFAACLRDHGVDVPDRARRAEGDTATPPSSRPPGSRPSTSLPAADQARLAAARQACQSLQPAERPAAGGPQGQAFQVYASCLKDHGVTITAGAGPGRPSRDDPAFQAADAICAPLRPAQP